MTKNANKFPARFAVSAGATRLTARIILLAMAGSIYSNAEPFDPALKIWENAPPDPTVVSDNKKGGVYIKENNKTIKWDLWGLVIGNGRLGATFYGNVADEVVEFNEDSLWSGIDAFQVNRNLELPTEIRPKIQAQINALEEELKNAPKKEQRPLEKQIKALTAEGQNRTKGAYQPFGVIHIKMPHEQFSDYHRELDLSRAVGTVTYTSGGVKYRREYVASYPDQVLAIRLTADKPGSITGNIQLSDHHRGQITSKKGMVTLRGKLKEEFYTIRVPGREILKVNDSVEAAEEAWLSNRQFVGNGMEFEAQMKVIHEGGRITDDGEGTLQVDNADSVLILLAADTDYSPDYKKDFHGSDPHDAVSQQLSAAAKQPYARLLKRHTDDYQALFNRVSLDLGKSSSEKRSMPMLERVQDFKENPHDPDLMELITQFGRYLLISSSRPGGQPANLQGLWNPRQLGPPWSSDYHLNINLQMNYWMTGPANLSECDEPLFQWMKAIMPVLRRETLAATGKPGISSPWGISLYGGGHGELTMGEIPWLCTHMYEHYRFTKDTQMLREVSYPVLKEAVLFSESSLVKRDGLYLAEETVSPEHGPREEGVMYAQQVFWELFSEFIEVSDVLGLDANYRKTIQAKRDKLAPNKIGSIGQLHEWQTEYVETDKKQHRHISHLFAVYPGRQIAPTTTPDLAKAAVVSLNYRGVDATGWSKMHKACAWARLLDGDKAMEQIRNYVKGHIWPSGLSSIKEGDKFQIDANLGVTAAVLELLLQSQTGELQLLPALPSEFKEGSVKGIRGRGGFLVDLFWSNGKLTRAVIHSQFGEPCNVRYGTKVVTLNMKKGEKIILDKSLNVVQ